MSEKPSSQKTKTIFIEPLTRIEGHLGIKVEIDVEGRKVVDAHSTGVMFRGLEIILKGRDPPDAVWITQRACGVCPTPHALASASALDMALNVTPPPLGTLLRNIIYAYEILYDHPLHIFQLAGPDYSEVVVKERNPSWLKAAQEKKAEHSEVHGFTTVADIMREMVPLKGRLWLESLDYERKAKEYFTVLAGKHPHAAGIIPGGVTQALSLSLIQELIFKTLELLAWVKKVVFVVEDLLAFLEEVGYDKVGVRPANLISYGLFDNPEVYDAKYENMDKWGVARDVTPGIVINGELVTNNLVEINLGIQEFVAHSFYKAWETAEIKEDPLGNRVPTFHPWNKDTIPSPAKIDWKGKYSWVTAPRWVKNGKAHVVEAGPLSRMWVTAVSRKVEASTGNSLKFVLPKTNMPLVPSSLNQEFELEWKVPGKVNVIERIRARAYYLAYTAHLLYNYLFKALEFIKAGRTKVFEPFKRPDWSLGVGMVEAARGALGHWIVVKNKRIHRYQIITPSTINASPRDHENQLSPYEESLVDTPVLEEVEPEAWNGTDVVRVVRSMDPCLACAINLYTVDRRIDKVIRIGG